MITITDDEIAKLPEDPERAFVEFERIIWGRLSESESMGTHSDNYDLGRDRREYMSSVIGAAGEYGIENIAQWKRPATGNYISDAYDIFISEVRKCTTQIRLRHRSSIRQDSVGLESADKIKIHHYIDRIREEIEKAELPDQKRDSLYKKLNKFALEVDKSRTSLQSGMAVFIDVCDGIGQGFNKLEPARKFFNPIAELLGRAQRVEDGLRPLIERPESRKELAAPWKGGASGPGDGDPDDEMPF